MTIDELIHLLAATERKNLTPAQELILCQAWEGETYTSMAAASIYEVDYLKTTAARLWQVISQLFDAPITKANFRASIEQRPLTSEQRELIEAFNSGQTPAISLEYPSGPVPLGSIFYIERPPVEEQAYQEITRPGSVVRIKAAKDMGKSSLMLRILAHAATLGYRTVHVSISQADATILASLDKFLRWLCTRVSQELNIQPNLDEYWDEDIGSKVSCTLYFKNSLLERLDTPLVLALNELHWIFEYPSVAQEFFPLLRSWYEEARHLEVWQQLRIVVDYSTEFYIPLKINQSPFNIGLPLNLPEFTTEQVISLAQRHGLNWQNGNQAKQLMAMVGGHPALVRLTLYHLVNPHPPLTQGGKANPPQPPLTKGGNANPPQPPLTKGGNGGGLKQLLQAAAKETGIYRAHLRQKLVTLQKNPELTDAFKQVVTANRPVVLTPILAYQLESMGLVKLHNDEVTVSCELYRLYFRKQFLVEENLSQPPVQLDEENP